MKAAMPDPTRKNRDEYKAENVTLDNQAIPRKTRRFTDYEKEHPE